MTLIHGRSHAREVVDETLALHVVYPLSFIFYDCDVHVTGAELLPTDLLLSRDVTVIEYKTERVNRIQYISLINEFCCAAASMYLRYTIKIPLQVQPTQMPHTLSSMNRQNWYLRATTTRTQMAVPCVARTTPTGRSRRRRVPRRCCRG